MHFLRNFSTHIACNNFDIKGEFREEVLQPFQIIMRKLHFTSNCQPGSKFIVLGMKIAVHHCTVPIHRKNIISDMASCLLAARFGLWAVECVDGSRGQIQFIIPLTGIRIIEGSVPKLQFSSLASRSGL
jgi:hypothetical protein